MLKITGGSFKGHSIKTLSGLKTRPTNSKVREAIFNILQTNIINTSWLDLFAGIGSIGIEALSRGAKDVTFIDFDYSAFSCLKQNTSIFEKEKVKLIKKDSIRFLSDCRESFDIIFLDPPYDSKYYEETFSIINKNTHLLNPNGFFIVEHRTKNNLPETNLLKLKNYKYGDTSLTIYKNNVE